MFIVLLKFSENRNKARDLMAGHNEWLKKGFDDGVFLLAGSLKPGLGGALLAHNISFDELQNRVSSDPFVADNVVTSEILEIDPTKASPSLEFLLGSKNA